MTDKSNSIAALGVQLFIHELKSAYSMYRVDLTGEKWHGVPENHTRTNKLETWLTRKKYDKLISLIGDRSDH